MHLLLPYFDCVCRANEVLENSHRHCSCNRSNNQCLYRLELSWIKPFVNGTFSVLSNEASCCLHPLCGVYVCVYRYVFVCVCVLLVTVLLLVARPRLEIICRADWASSSTIGWHARDDHWLTIRLTCLPTSNLFVTFIVGWDNRI